MFTGIVEEVGRVDALEKGDALVRLTTASTVVHEGARIGDSVAVNGVCLTVVAIDGARLAFEAVPETLRRTNLGALAVGSPVDLERPVSAARPMGGHYVQGHVDGTVGVRARRPDGDAVEVWFDAPPALMRYVVPKGYVTVDGASLTVVETDDAGFSVTLVPHTQKSVVFGAAEPGYVANLEVDVMAKYVERMIGPRLEALEARLAALEER
ncbi:MAG TPA: riboflavin synthase [Sandaracinaceae bacterium LLY-WYZ-13_1]|nr:riboflavin synthase [Sandaracinaceae bacterium LLY-WYZ-13_1]